MGVVRKTAVTSKRKQIREERNLPLRKVAAQLDVDTSTLSKVERGERPMSIDYIKPLSQILKIDTKNFKFGS